MASTLCPQCKTLVRHGFWEIFDACPGCGAPWPVDPEARPQALSKLALVALAFALGAFIPVVGFLLGIAAVAMGYIASQLGRRVAGIAAIVLGVTVGIIGQPLLTYWGIGHYRDRACISDLTTLSDSIYAYRALTHRYPPNLEAMSAVRLPTPTECPVGGKTYFYMSPAESQAPASAPASAPCQPATQPAAAQAESAPACPGCAMHRMPSERPYGASRPAGHGTPTIMPSMPATCACRCASQPAEEAGDAHTLLVAEALPDEHRGGRNCITTDLVVRTVPEEAFAGMLKAPRNRRFAAGLDKAYRAATQPATQPASQPASKPASQPTSRSASQAASRSSSGPASRPATSPGA